jgi:hypothetical protein
MILPVAGWVADIVGMVGTALIVGAYAYLTFGKTVRPIAYNLMNLVGALLLALSLLVHWNLASFILELVWIAVALAGIAKALRAQGRPAP